MLRSLFTDIKYAWDIHTHLAAASKALETCIDTYNEVIPAPDRVEVDISGTPETWEKHILPIFRGHASSLEQSIQRYEEGDQGRLRSTTSSLRSIPRGIAERSDEWLDLLSTHDERPVIAYLSAKGRAVQMASNMTNALTGRFTDDHLLNPRVVGFISDRTLKRATSEDNAETESRETLVERFQSALYAATLTDNLRRAQRELHQVAESFRNSPSDSDWESWPSVRRPDGWVDTLKPMLEDWHTQMLSTEFSTSAIRVEPTASILKNYQRKMESLGWDWILYTRSVDPESTFAFFNTSARIIRCSQNIFYSAFDSYSTYSDLTVMVTGE